MVQDWLMHLQDRRNVELACCDMWIPYKEAIRAALLQAAIKEGRSDLRGIMVEAAWVSSSITPLEGSV